MSATNIRQELLSTLDHVQSAFGKLLVNTGRGANQLSFPDLHKTTEGLFLSAWTYWEQFLRELLIYDLATDPSGMLREEVKVAGFRLKQSPFRLARLVLEHPDEEKWVEWSSIDAVKVRASSLLGPNHRFANLSGNTVGSVRRLKKIRNAVAHKSDHAWQQFRDVVQKQPYSLARKSLKGLTTGRFLSAHKVGTDHVFVHCVGVLRGAATTLVP